MAGKAVTATLPLVAAALLAGCGGGTSPHAGQAFPPAEDPDCQATVSDAMMRLGGVREADVQTHLLYSAGRGESSKCAYGAGGERVTIEVDSTAQAYADFRAADARRVHADVGHGSAAPRARHPRRMKGVGRAAWWLPAQRQLLATNASRTRGGAFIRVIVQRRANGAPPDRKAARIVARASLETAPVGPTPQS